MQPYSIGFRAKVVKKMISLPERSAASFAEEVGVHKSTLAKWRRSVYTIGSMRQKEDQKRKSTRQWTGGEKLEVINKASTLKDEELGQFLREKGLHEAQLEMWQKEALEGLSGGNGKRDLSSKLAAERKQTKKLEREIHRKDKALAEAAALLVLQKKVQAIWGDGDDNT